MKHGTNRATGAGVVLVAAALASCGSSLAVEEVVPERATAAADEARHEAPSAPRASADVEAIAVATEAANDGPSPESATATTPDSLDTVAAIGPESGDTAETARPRRRIRRAGAAVNARSELPVATAPAAREEETTWTRPFPVSRAGIRWDRMGEERTRVFRRREAAQRSAAAAGTGSQAEAPATNAARNDARSQGAR